MMLRDSAFLTALCIVFVCLGCPDFVSGEIKHPGVAHSSDDFEFVKQKIAEKQQPWIGAWRQLKKSKFASLSYQPNPYEEVVRGSYNNPDIGSTEFSRDGRAAYVHALIWMIGEDVDHARKATEILDAWSGKLKKITDHDARLLAGMSGYHYCIAAELMKHGWDGWPESSQTKFRQMMLKVWYPLVKDLYPSANGNWDASMMQLMMAIGVHSDDQELIDRVAEYFLNGVGNGAVGNYFNDIGQCQESGRDQAHSQMGLEFLSNTCQTAWIQGVDLYSAKANRLLKGFEYTAKYNLGEEVPFKKFPSYEGRYDYPSISDKARGRFRPTYEKVVRHYQVNQGISAPHSQQAAKRLRELKSRRDNTARVIDILMFATEPLN